VDELPIYPVEETLDLNSVLYGRIYRKRLELCNRTRAACKVTIKVASLFSKYVEVNPSMVFVQAKAVQIVNLKFTPTPDITKRLSYFSVPFEDFANAAALRIPIEIEMANQELPTFFILKASVSQSTILLSTQSLNFQKVYVGQQVSLPLTITNTSMLPQKVAFVRLKKQITVEPNSGFTTLLPNESFTFDVRFAPTNIVEYSFDICLLSSVNDKYMIRVIGELMRSFLPTASFCQCSGPYYPIDIYSNVNILMYKTLLHE
jgi:Abnormal spindle-like microcephaly-assoc'd, ASPM-SPD-2-Hydin